jgi:excisionase family DNA binding protein
MAVALRVSRRTVYDRIASGDLAAIRIGTGRKPPLRIPADALGRYVTPTRGD